MHRECLLGTRFLDLPQSVVIHSILICIVVILQNARICHTSHAVGVSFDASVSFEFISVTDACTHIQNMCCDTSPFACTKRGDANSVSLMATHDQQQNLANADQKYCTFTLKSVTLPIAVHGQFCKPYSIAHVKHGWTVAHLTMCVGRDCGNVFLHCCRPP